MFDPEFQMYPWDAYCELVTLVSFLSYIRGDYRGFSMVFEADSI
jgi:hypothetical protein